MFDAICDSNRDREAWLEARRLGAPASETPTILGANRYQSAIELWTIRHGDLPPVDLSDRESVFWGHALEASIIDGYHKRTGRSVVPFGLLLRSRTWPWMLATPDALVSESATPRAAWVIHSRVKALRKALASGDGVPKAVELLAAKLGGWWPLQIKNVGLRMAEHWADGPPLEYQYQAMHEAMVLGADRCTVAGLIGGQQLVWDDYEADPDDPMCRQIRNRTLEFVESIKAHVPPAPDGSDSAKRTLAKLYPETDPDTVIELGSDLQDDAREYDRLGNEIKALKNERQAIENRVRAAIESNERAVFADGTGFSLKTVSMPARQQAASAYRKLTRFGAKRRKGETHGT